MEIILPQDFLQITRNKHILIDTCMLIDAFGHNKEFGNFFNKLKDNDSTLITTSLVLNEFLKGSSTDEKFNNKKEFVLDIVESILPTVDVQEYIEILIRKYGIESKDLSEADLNLGGSLARYGKNIFLLTRDLSDFPTTIFSRVSFLNVSFSKGVFVYGLYSYIK